MGVFRILLILINLFLLGFLSSNSAGPGLFSFRRCRKIKTARKSLFSSIFDGFSGSSNKTVEDAGINGSTVSETIQAPRMIYASPTSVKLNKLFLAYDVINGAVLTRSEFMSLVIGLMVKLDSLSMSRRARRRERAL